MTLTRTLSITLALVTLGACSDGGGGSSAPPPDRAPTVSAIADTTVPANSDERRIAFSVSDDQTDPGALTVSAQSDNDDLLDGDGPAVAGAGDDRELLLVPAPGIVGMATITVTVTDAAGQSATTSFLYTVAPQQVAFSAAARTAFAADENDEPQTVNDKEYDDDMSTYDDLVRN